MSKKSNGYNGWSNYETWGAALWISENEDLYRQMIDQRDAGDLDHDSIYMMITGFYPNGVPDWEGNRANYARVNWQELVDSFLDESSKEQNNGYNKPLAHTLLIDLPARIVASRHADEAQTLFNLEIRIDNEDGHPVTVNGVVIPCHARLINLLNLEVLPFGLVYKFNNKKGAITIGEKITIETIEAVRCQASRELIRYSETSVGGIHVHSDPSVLWFPLSQLEESGVI